MSSIEFHRSEVLKALGNFHTFAKEKFKVGSVHKATFNGRVRDVEILSVKRNNPTLDVEIIAEDVEPNQNGNKVPLYYSLEQFENL